MIVDVHTHTPAFVEPVPEDEVEYNTVNRPAFSGNIPRTISYVDYLEAMGPVDRAFVFGIAPPPWVERGTGHWLWDQNDKTAALVKRAPEKLIGFMSVHPFDPGFMEEMDRCVNDLGLKGMKLGPNYQDFDPHCDEARKLYGRATEIRIPIVFHQGTSPRQMAPLRYAHPTAMDEIAMAFPELRIVMAHMGHPWQADVIAVIRKHPNVYADVSALFYRPWSFVSCMQLAMEWGVLDKLVFGSDYPAAGTPQETMDGLRSLNETAHRYGLDGVPEEALEEIIHRDSLALLGVEV